MTTNQKTHTGKKKQNPYYIGLGSNIEPRRKNLEKALEAISSFMSIERLSPVYETPALLPPKAKAEWNKPFLNLVLKGQYSSTPPRLLQRLKALERKLGRSDFNSYKEKERQANGAPRPIDLDILLWGEEGEKSYSSKDLSIPHREMINRSFVLDPLTDIFPNPYLRKLACQRPQHAPLWMVILNVTSDSFSDGGSITNVETFTQKVLHYVSLGVHILDIGAESTRPEALPLSPQEEWARLEPYLKALQRIYPQPGIPTENKNLKGSPFLKPFLRPLISIDTRHVSTAEKALKMGANIINDVSGLRTHTNRPEGSGGSGASGASSKSGGYGGSGASGASSKSGGSNRYDGEINHEMLSLLRNSKALYVLMHSLDIPANPGNTLPEEKDPLPILCQWLENKLEVLEKNKISLDRIFFDPGIGFGKNALQSLKILKNLETFKQYPVRLLVGHSRKSFMKNLSFATINPKMDLKIDPKIDRSKMDPKMDPMQERATMTMIANRDLYTLGFSMKLIQKGVDVLRIHNPEIHIATHLGWNHATD